MLRVNQRRVVLHQPGLLALGEFSVASSKCTKTSTQGREGSIHTPREDPAAFASVGRDGGAPRAMERSCLVCVHPSWG